MSYAGQLASVRWIDGCRHDRNILTGDFQCYALLSTTRSEWANVIASTAHVMKKHSERFSTWLLWGLLSIPLVVVTYFYLLLHVGCGVPVEDLWFPALAFCAFVPFFSTVTWWGYRARVRGEDGVLMFVGFGAFALLCGFEFRYFEMKLVDRSTSVGVVIV